MNDERLDFETLLDAALEEMADPGRAIEDAIGRVALADAAWLTTLARSGRYTPAAFAQERRRQALSRGPEIRRCIAAKGLMPPANAEMTAIIQRAIAANRERIMGADHG